jgi:hypothetical protein
VVKEYGDNGESAQAVQAWTVRQPYLRAALRFAGTSVRSLATGRGVGYLRLSQRMFRNFPPSKSGKMILAQSQRATQGQTGGKVLHLVLFALLFPLFGARLVAHVGESFRRPSLQRIRGAVVRDDLYRDVFGPTPGAEISSFKARVSASMAARSSLALVIRACSERTKRV